MPRIQHVYTDGGKVVSPTLRSRSTPQKHYSSASGAHFCQRLGKLQGLERPEGLGTLKKCINLIGSRTRDLNHSATAYIN
jgi:hypothetical protein